MCTKRQKLDPAEVQRPKLSSRSQFLSDDDDEEEEGDPDPADTSRYEAAGGVTGIKEESCRSQ